MDMVLRKSDNESRLVSQVLPVVRDLIPAGTPDSQVLVQTLQVLNSVQQYVPDVNADDIVSLIRRVPEVVTGGRAVVSWMGQKLDLFKKRKYGTMLNDDPAILDNKLIEYSKTMENADEVMLGGAIIPVDREGTIEEALRGRPGVVQEIAQLSNEYDQSVPKRLKTTTTQTAPVVEEIESIHHERPPLQIEMKDVENVKGPKGRGHVDEAVKAEKTRDVPPVRPRQPTPRRRRGSGLEVTLKKKKPNRVLALLKQSPNYRNENLGIAHGNENLIEQNSKKVASALTAEIHRVGAVVAKPLLDSSKALDAYQEVLQKAVDTISLRDEALAVVNTADGDRSDPMIVDTARIAASLDESVIQIEERLKQMNADVIRFNVENLDRLYKGLSQEINNATQKLMVAIDTNTAMDDENYQDGLDRVHVEENNETIEVKDEVLKQAVVEVNEELTASDQDPVKMFLEQQKFQHPDLTRYQSPHEREGMKLAGLLKKKKIPIDPKIWDSVKLGQLKAHYEVIKGVYTQAFEGVKEYDEFKRQFLLKFGEDVNEWPRGVDELAVAIGQGSNEMSGRMDQMKKHLDMIDQFYYELKVEVAKTLVQQTAVVEINTQAREKVQAVQQGLYLVQSSEPDLRSLEDIHAINIISEQARSGYTFDFVRAMGHRDNETYADALAVRSDFKELTGTDISNPSDQFQNMTEQAIMHVTSESPRITAYKTRLCKLPVSLCSFLSNTNLA